MRHSRANLQPEPEKHRHEKDEEPVNRCDHRNLESAHQQRGSDVPDRLDCTHRLVQPDRYAVQLHIPIDTCETVAQPEVNV